MVTRRRLLNSKKRLYIPTITIGGTLYYCGMGADNDNNVGLYLRNSSQNRRTLVYDSGDVKYRCRQSTSSQANFTACPDIDYYPIRIPAGATSLKVTTPANMRVSCTIAEISTEYGISTGYYHRVNEGLWDTASRTHVFDVSAYNDGSYFACFNLETTLTNEIGFTLSFE